MITFPVLEQVLNIPYINGDSSRNLGRRFKEPVRLFMKKYTKCAGRISSSNTVFILNDAPQELRVFLEKVKDEPNSVERRYNLYSELITDDLKYVTPVVSGQLKDVLPQYISIQRDNLSEENHLVMQFINKPEEMYTITKFDLTDIFVGALPEFVLKNFLFIYKEFSFESIQYLLDRGYRIGLQPIVDTIGSLNLTFKQDQITWMKSITHM